MGLFSEGARMVTPNKLTFTDRLDNVKSLFRKSYEVACNLNVEMQAEMDKKNDQIQLINSEIKDIKAVQDETVTFMSNLEKFI